MNQLQSFWSGFVEGLGPEYAEQSTLILIVAVVLYFVPSVIAIGRRNFFAIFALNLLTGWTAIGWIIALVWSLTKPPEEWPGKHH